MQCRCCKNKAHPAYGTLCEDCWAECGEEAVGHFSTTTQAEWVKQHPHGTTSGSRVIRSSKPDS